jgi:hypothetical protein
MRYCFIQVEKATYPVEVLCRVLEVARSGFYAWCHRPRGVRAQQNDGLVTQILTCYHAARGRYGSPRIHQDLRAQGVRVGRHRVARLNAASGTSQYPSASRLAITRHAGPWRRRHEHLAARVCRDPAE